MIKTKSLLILISTLLFSNYHLSFSEELTITTYYPSPVGIYKELRAKKMAIGDNYYNPSDYSWGSEISSDADLVVEGKVGIGVLKPEKELHVAGDAKIENDLNVEGGVVIGNPEGGNKGTGTINAKKIYVNGSEVGGGECVIVIKGRTGNGDIYSGCPGMADPSCPSDYPNLIYVSEYNSGYNSVGEICRLKIGTCCK